MRNTETQYRTLHVNKLRTNGYSRNLGLGEYGFVNFNKVTPDGYPVLKEFDSIPRGGSVLLRGGGGTRTSGKGTTNKDIGSMPFKFDEITNFYVEAPETTEIKVDKMILGYNGAEGTGFKLNKDSYLTIGVELQGPALGFAGYKDSKLFIQEQIFAPRELPAEDNFIKGVTYPTSLEKRTMTEIIEDAVERILAKPLMDGTTVGDHIKMKVISSDAPTITGEEFTFWHLNMPCDNGNLFNLGSIQSQYPDSVVQKDVLNISDNHFSYVMTLPQGETPADYVRTMTDVKLDCVPCEDESEFHYSIVGEVAQEDVEGAIEGITGFAVTGKNAEGVSVSEFSSPVELGADIYEVVSSVDGFVSMSFADKTNEQCSTETSQTFKWTEGETCTAIEKTFEIRVPDTECGESRLEELQKFYGDAYVITEVEESDKVCMRTYSTKVLSNIECEECSTDIYSIYEASSPKDFGTSIWKKVKTGTYTEDAEVGIYLEGKKFILTGEDNGIATVIGSTEIMNIYASDRLDTLRVSESWSNNVDIHKEWLQRASIPDGLGYEMYGDLLEGQYYFTGRTRIKGNQVYNYFHGLGNSVKPLTPYVHYYLTIQKKETIIGYGHIGQNVTYDFMVEVGQHEELEEVLNNLAIKAGLDPVKAYK